jgi:hypothetical protein
MATYSNLYLHITPSLEPEHWYTITEGAISHTAFNYMDDVDLWLARRGLDRGVTRSADTLPIVGSYSTKIHTDTTEFFALEGVVGRIMDNANYTMSIDTIDGQGHVTIHFLSVNVKNRPIYNEDGVQLHRSFVYGSKKTTLNA